MKLSSIARDLAGVAGAALISFGAWRIYPPAGFIVCGALLVLGAVLSARAPE